MERSTSKVGQVAELFMMLDRISPHLGSLVTEQKLVDISALSTRYYIALHDVLLPIAVKDSGDSVPKVLLTPNTTVYIHEQKIYAVLKTRSIYGFFDANVVTYIPAVELSSNENLLMLTSSALAYKVFSSPNEKNILRIMPNNIRIYMEFALKTLEEPIDSSSLKDLPTPNNPQLNILEFVLWFDELRVNEIAEVRYLRGITMRVFKIIYQDHEIDLRAFSPVTNKVYVRLFSILPQNILTNILNNIEGAYRILITYLSMRH